MKLSRRQLGCVCVTGLLCSSAWSQSTERVSVSTSGSEGNADSRVTSISPDGRFVVFYSSASNFVAGDTNGTRDVFLRDRWIGSTERVSLGSGVAQANGASDYASISDDGRYVQFESYATNLVAGDTNAVCDVFVRDRSAGSTQRVSVASNGAQANSVSYGSSMSADGRYVALMSSASNLVAGDTNGCRDVFVRDRVSGTTVRASVATSGIEGNADSFGPVISADGRFLAFTSRATNFAAGGGSVWGNVYVRDRLSATTEFVGVGYAGNTGGGSYSSAISADGRFVAFDSPGPLVMGDTNSSEDVYVRDRASGALERASIATGGAQGNGHCQPSSISADGRFVAFSSAASNLVAGDTNGKWDIFLRDRAAGLLERVSVSSGGTQADGDTNYFCPAPCVSADGRFVAFSSGAANLVAGDTNATIDVFVRDRACAVCSYCTGGTTTHGCVASISSTGVPSASSISGFTISASSVEGRRLGTVIYGIDNSAFVALPWGQGTSYQCVKQPWQRTGIQVSGGTLNACDGSLSLDWCTFVATHSSALGCPFGAGVRVFAQAWFRDLTAPKASNLSDALAFVVQP
jgi:Tol biopolymer transport system component